MLLNKFNMDRVALSRTSLGITFLFELLHSESGAIGILPLINFRVPLLRTRNPLTFIVIKLTLIRFSNRHFIPYVAILVYYNDKCDKLGIL